MPDDAILLLEDDLSLSEVLTMILSADGYKVYATDDGAVALDWLKDKSKNIRLIIQDIRMKKMDGLTFLDAVVKLKSHPPSIVMTAYSTWDVCVEAMRLGAYDYIRKPFDNDDVRTVVNRAISHGKRADDLARKGISGFMSVADIIGSSDQMGYVFDIVNRLAGVDSTVLISGESGTGKELIARAVHYASPRAEKPFVGVNCGAFTESLLESELFGHMKGAFTGAVENRPGLFQVANQGTLFLDEVGEMTLRTQVKLLRVLETRSFVPVGGVKTDTVDIRVIAATNRDLKAMTKSGEFREDLFYRLNVIPLHLPPLRERTDDLPLLAGHFLSKYSERMGRTIKKLDEGAIKKLTAYHWPGNVRELENAIEIGRAHV